MKTFKPFIGMLTVCVIINTVSINYCYGQNIKISFPALDTSDYNIELFLPKRYSEDIKFPILQNEVHISKNDFYKNDSLILIRSSDTNFPSFYFSIEPIDINKAANPEAFSNSIVKQFTKHNVEINDVAIKSIATKKNINISKLIYKLEGNGYVSNYTFFINNRSITIGIAHSSKLLVEQYEANVLDLTLRKEESIHIKSNDVFLRK